MPRRPRFTGGSFSLTLERYVEETDDYIEITVEGTFDAGTPARTWGPPDNWDPGDPGELEIQASYYIDDDGNQIDVELTVSEEAEVNERGPEQAESNWDDDYDDYQYERYRDRYDDY